MYFLLGTLLLLAATTSAEKTKIAVVGGGIGGASVSYFLRQEFPDADIATFESSSVLGGRLATVEVDGRSYETGGSIIHSANKYMTNFLEICKMKKKQSAPDAPFSLHKDGEVVFQVRETVCIFRFYSSVTGVGISSDRQGEDGVTIRDRVRA